MRRDIHRRIEKLEAGHRGPPAPALWVLTPDEAGAVVDILMDAGGVELVQTVLRAQRGHYDEHSEAD